MSEHPKLPTLHTSTKQPQDSSKLQKYLLLNLWQFELTEAARKKAGKKVKKYLDFLRRPKKN
jgi:hypothetical protein